MAETFSDWEKIIDSFTDLISIQSKDYKYIKVNKAFADALKMKPEKIVGKTCYELIHKTKEPRQQCPHKKTLETKKPATEEFFEPNLGVYLQVSTSPFFDDKGEVAGTVHIARDITESKKTMESLKEKKEFSDALFDTAQVIMLMLDTEGRVVRFNPYTEEVSGYSLKEVKGKDWFTTFLPKRDRGRIKEIFQKAKDDIQTRGNVNSIITKQGEERFIEWYDKTFKDNKGNVLGLLAVGQDVTERKKAEVSLLEMKDKYSVVLENLDDVVFQLSPLGTIEYVSPGAKDWMGYMPEELIGKHLKVTTPATEMPKALNALKRVLSGEKIKSFNMKQRHADGRILDMEINALPIRIEGKIVAVQGIMRDITDCKNVEQEMQNTLSDLENFKKATIARENVMIELKKEINKLSQELGRSAPHDLSFLE